MSSTKAVIKVGNMYFAGYSTGEFSPTVILADNLKQASIFEDVGMTFLENREGEFIVEILEDLQENLGLGVNVVRAVSLKSKAKKVKK